MKKTILALAMLALAACSERRTILVDPATGCTYAVRLSRDGEYADNGHLVADARGRTTCRDVRGASTGVKG